ncbi:MAG: thiopurine S-methyltransferase [Gammaproteobacteria bacterium]|nr:thiopurine S-methyltransferase [Gammaproteobacteria bacterium]MDH4253710.1 thiopurine S-methyltransferase [Gammaproteobacteria bacterium]MDH5309988.1 thiopurine S-methyltransferase [Gammaproteobacteria bacterium]
MSEDWAARWREGRTGWHEQGGSALLRRYWPALPSGSSVLVPLCGKSVDLLWLARQGYDVTGIELSEIAVQALFAENSLGFETTIEGGLPCYRAGSLPLRVCCGDFFAWSSQRFDALYDRGALVAVDPRDRARYTDHVKSLLHPDAFRMIITLEYEQDKAPGPPWSVPADELLAYWQDLQRAFAHDDLANCPPKFRAAGLTEMLEVVWLSR